MKHIATQAGFAWLVLIYAGGPALSSVPRAISQEFSVFNAPIVSIAVNSAVSREFSIYYVPGADAAVRGGVSREFSILNSPLALLSPNHAISREFSAVVPPYTIDEAANALRIAAGLSQVSQDTVDRLDVISKAPSTNIVDILDACAVSWYAAHPPPGY